MKLESFKGKVIGKSAFGEVYEGFPQNFYEVKEFPFADGEAALAKLLEGVIQRKSSFTDFAGVNELPDGFEDAFRDEVVSVIELNSLLEKLPSRKLSSSLAKSLATLLANVSFIADKNFFAEVVLQDSIGLKQLAFFFADPNLEELMVNGLDSIFVFHKEFGMCKTNVALDEKAFGNIVQRMAISVGKQFGPKDSLLDARLPDGSRVNATYSDVSPKGITLTIRKFAPVPITILDLIESNTLTSEAAAFLWVMVDGFDVNPANILITGGTATGKTTLLNVLANFIRFNKRIVSIEDTLELSLLGRDNWVPLETKHSIGEEVSMDSLLRNSLRMRPDRLVVGEVRGPEASTLFNAMDTGHQGCLGTIHANNAREMIIKLQEKPLSVPQSMLPLVDLIIVLGRHFSKEKGIQRNITQIAEVTRMENKVLLGTVYDFDRTENSLRRTVIPSHIFEEMAERATMTKNDLKQEISIRQGILEWMVKQNIRKPMEVLEVIQAYYFDQEEVLSIVSKGLS